MAEPRRGAGGPARLLACGIFRAEYALLPEELRSRLEPVFLDSMLHMRPLDLDAALRGSLAKEGGLPCAILYGDCCPFMREFAEGEGRARVRGDNCAEIFLGRERYRELKRKRAFFFLPEWVERWEEIFDRELGLGDPELARSFMQDKMRLLVYVDTGLAPFPTAELARIEERFGLPFVVERPGLGFLESALREALGELLPGAGAGRAASEREASARGAPARGVGPGAAGSEADAAPDEAGAGPSVGSETAAYEFLFSDLVERILSLADQPSACVEYIARELRSLVGARSIFVYECPGFSGEHRHRLVSVLPERRRPLGEDPRLDELAGLTHDFEEARFVSAGPGGRVERILEELGLGDSLAIPLRYGRKRVGVLLLLDLLDRANLGAVLESLSNMSSVLALILRNAFLYENLEEAVRDRTAELERQRAALADSLREKEVMLKEIHHRVKNNLQMVSSLLYLKMSGIDDPEVRALFAESQSRVQAMALVHEELYGSDDLSRVDMDSYVRRLAEGLAGARRGVTLAFDLEPTVLLAETALPCGLVLNEFLMNAFKYGLDGRPEGRVDVSFRREGSSCVLEVSDDGPGFPPAFSPEKTTGLGYSIVLGLAEQLKGLVSVGKGPGARVSLTFPEHGP